jgi:transcription-repair coupling factor (superfamily II helicase)
MSKIKLIRTLPHLHPLFFPKRGSFVYANLYSPDIVNWLESCKVYTLKDLKFSFLLNYLQRSNPESEETHYKKVDTVSEKLEYSIKGDIVNFWPVGYSNPIRASFFDQDCEELYIYDELYGRKIRSVDSIVISEVQFEDKTDMESIVADSLQPSAFSFEKLIFTNTLRGIGISDIEKFEVIDTDFTLPPLFYAKTELFEAEVKRLENQGYDVIIKTKSEELEVSKYTSKQVTSKNLSLGTCHLSLDVDYPAGFISEKLKVAVFTDREIFGTIYLSRPERTKKLNNNIQKLLRQFEGNIELGDYVVHEDYGLAVYAGLTQESVDGQMMEYLELHYAADDQLLVPINQVEKITKYIGNEGTEPKLSRLGRVSWNHIKEKVKKSTSILARELVEHYAKREIAKSRPIDIEDSADYLKFVDEFKFKETDDQIRSANEVIADLSKDTPMNRLLVGDVGFGKTEVMMRAAFKVVESGGQVAVLSPTTVLTAQHFEVFKERFKSFPITIEFLSRFNSTQKNNEIVDRVNAGKVDIIIGTHRVLSNDLKFKKLELLIVDEEQRFGVAQKEKIKKLNYGTHVLSVSATPIPRTLSMALSSIHDISIISTPPVNRKSIKTEIVKDDWKKIADAIQDEIKRGGQIFFVHNQVMTINILKEKLEKLTPGVKFVVAHGRMSPNELDRIMAEFYLKKFDCLIATTIIENGLDIPNVNTIIVNKAHRFGLSQLYQLRGRVGRSNTQAFCYLMYEGRDIVDNDEMQIMNYEKGDVKTPKQKQKNYLDRLQTLVDNQDLGAGFRVASRDLEIRGAGNLLGDQQSGYISTIGYALYIEILAQEVERVKEEMMITLSS